MSDDIHSYVFCVVAKGEQINVPCKNHCIGTSYANETARLEHVRIKNIIASCIPIYVTNMENGMACQIKFLPSAILWSLK